jgi:peptidoglycan biosynthesis protein MviN/MurJ (putative lipid II flippase)
VAASSALVGAAVMVAGGLLVESRTGRVAALGFGHSAAYFAGTLVLGALLRRRVGHPFFPRAFLPALGVSVTLGVLAWWVEDLIRPAERIDNIAVLAAIGLIGAGLYAVMLRLLPKRADRFEAAFAPGDPDLAVEP